VCSFNPGSPLELGSKVGRRRERKKRKGRKEKRAPVNQLCIYYN
jgi:hypothetical protein